MNKKPQIGSNDGELVGSTDEVLKVKTQKLNVQ